MKYVVNGSQMKEIDEYTIREIGIPSFVLMEKAAMAAVDVILKSIVKEDKILAVCGTGNNGGDGVAVARILFHLGFDADILLLGEEEKSTEQTKIQLNIARNIGVNIFNQLEINEYNIIIDALFGIGLSKAVTGRYASIINQINQLQNRVYSIDIPSGISANDGKVLNTAIKADETITFGFLKLGHLLYPGSEYAGIVTVKDIGFSPKALMGIRPEHFIYEPEDILRLPVRQKYSNKGTYGKVLVMAGSKEISGACFLAAKAAYRTGAGLVKIMTAIENKEILQTLLPEALSFTYDEEENSDSLREGIINEIQQATSIVIGPGIGVSNMADQLLQLVLKYSKVPTIIDADAINLLAKEKEYEDFKENNGIDINVNLPNNFILTPHLKEMSRLMNRTVQEIAENILQTANLATKEKQYTLVLKDARTLVAGQGKIYINTSGNNGMATGGSGDVLTGIIAGLLAQGMSAFEAAALGVYLHGLAGDHAMREKGVYSLMASDIIEALPCVVRD